MKPYTKSNETIYQIDGKKRYFAHQLLELGLASSFLECLNFLLADVGHSKGLGIHQLRPQTQVLHAPIGESTVQAAHDLDEIVPAQGADKTYSDIYLTLFFWHLSDPLFSDIYLTLLFLFCVNGAQQKNEN